MKVWWLRDDKLAVAELSGSTFTTLSTAGDTIRIYYSKSTESIADIPSQYHEGIVGKVVERLATAKQDYNTAGYYKMEYQDAIKKAKVESNTAKTGSAFEIRGYDF